MDKRFPSLDAGMVAQWMGLEGQCANAVAPLLVSTEQGRCK